MARNNAAQLDRSLSALASINSTISDLAAKRAARLLAGDNAGAIGRIDAEIETQRHAAKTETIALNC